MIGVCVFLLALVAAGTTLEYVRREGGRERASERASTRFVFFSVQQQMHTHAAGTYVQTHIYVFISFIPPLHSRNIYRRRSARRARPSAAERRTEHLRLEMATGDDDRYGEEGGREGEREGGREVGKDVILIVSFVVV
jgi:hypothetical protein